MRDDWDYSTRRLPRYLAATMGLLLLTAACGRWPVGTWVPVTPDWTGELVVERGVESWDFELSLVGPTRNIVWEGGAKRVDGGLRLSVFHEKGVCIYPDRHFSLVLTREDRSLIIPLDGTRVELQKR